MTNVHGASKRILFALFLSATFLLVGLSTKAGAQSYPPPTPTNTPVATPTNTPVGTPTKTPKPKPKNGCAITGFQQTRQSVSFRQKTEFVRGERMIVTGEQEAAPIGTTRRGLVRSPARDGPDRHRPSSNREGGYAVSARIPSVRGLRLAPCRRQDQRPQVRGHDPRSSRITVVRTSADGRSVLSAVDRPGRSRDRLLRRLPQAPCGLLSQRPPPSRTPTFRCSTRGTSSALPKPPGSWSDPRSCEADGQEGRREADRAQEARRESPYAKKPAAKKPSQKKTVDPKPGVRRSPLPIKGTATTDRAGSKAPKRRTPPGKDAEKPEQPSTDRAACDRRRRRTAELERQLASSARSRSATSRRSAGGGVGAGPTTSGRRGAPMMNPTTNPKIVLDTLRGLLRALDVEVRRRPRSAVDDDLGRRESASLRGPRCRTVSRRGGGSQTPELVRAGATGGAAPCRGGCGRRPWASRGLRCRRLRRRRRRRVTVRRVLDPGSVLRVVDRRAVRRRGEPAQAEREPIRR